MLIMFAALNSLCAFLIQTLPLTMVQSVATLGLFSALEYLLFTQRGNTGENPILAFLARKCNQSVFNLAVGVLLICNYLFCVAIPVLIGPFHETWQCVFSTGVAFLILASTVAIGYTRYNSELIRYGLMKMLHAYHGLKKLDKLNLNLERENNEIEADLLGWFSSCRSPEKTLKWLKSHYTFPDCFDKYYFCLSTRQMSDTLLAKLEEWLPRVSLHNSLQTLPEKIVMKRHKI